MCLIIQRPPGVTLDKEDFLTAVANNPDGWGLSVPGENGYLHTMKDLNSDNPEDLYELLHGDLKDDSVMLHLRYTTAGETSMRNAHPFPILEMGTDGVDLRMAHNGTIHKYKPSATANNKWESDTRVFVREFVRPLFKRLIKGISCDQLLKDDFVYDLLNEQLPTTSTISFIDGWGNTLEVNPLGNGGEYTDDGVWFSNKYSFNPKHREPKVNTGFTMGTGYTGGASTPSNFPSPDTFKDTDQSLFSDMYSIQDMEELFSLSDETISMLVDVSPLSAERLIKEVLLLLYNQNKDIEELEARVKRLVSQVADGERKLNSLEEKRNVA